MNSGRGGDVLSPLCQDMDGGVPYEEIVALVTSCINEREGK